MSYYKPGFRHPDLPKNELGYTQSIYEGSMSTLCAGCGHDSISAAVIQAVWESNIEPYNVAKISGIGCSSKTPNYFLDKAHGFNTVHGRMPSVTIGAQAANRELVYIGISGDGDTASIGIGQFVHAIRRNLNMVYLVENNGCYGLTKGQDSATADVGATSKRGDANPYKPVDLIGLALQLECSFVARSFSGDKAQLVPLLRAAIAHRGFALIDVISPCVTFNNHEGSTKSYQYARDHIETNEVLDFIPYREEIVIASEQSQAVRLHSGETIHLHQTDKGHDPSDRLNAIARVQEAIDQGKILTGLIHLDSERPDWHSIIGTSEKPLNSMREAELCPGNHRLETINNSLR